MSLSSASRHFDVAILGGGIAGLTLALILERVGVRFVLWEIHESIAPELGAGIGLLPSGLRILDQMGLLDEIESQTVPLKTWHHIDDSGKPIAVVDASNPHYSVGYDGRFLERSKLLGIIYNAIQNKDAVRTSITIDRIEKYEDHATLIAAEGCWVTANVIVGADGVRSSIRQHIEQSVGIQAHKDMRTEFTCVFGMSPAMSDLKEGESFAVYREAASVLVFTGRGIIFWFVFEDLGHAHPLAYRSANNIDDMEEACQSVGHLHLTPTVTFADIVKNTTSIRKTTLEEGLAIRWHADRMVVIGDAAHKMVPHAAMGANQAMESAAALANELQRINRADRRWEMANITAALERYTHARHDRVAAVIKRAGDICRAQLCRSGYGQMVEALPKLRCVDWMVQSLGSLRGACVIESLPLTERGKYFELEMSGIFDELDKDYGGAGVSDEG